MIKPFPKPRPILILERHPWREYVTLCVAAECKRHKRFFNALVFATDFAVEGEIASADIGRKMVCGGSEWYPILLAGTQTRALALARMVLGVAESQRQPIDKDSFPLDWDAILSESVLRAKNLIANEIVSSRFGITYSEFLKAGKTSFPDDVFRDTVSDISRSSLDCWLLVLSFSHNHARIYRLSDAGVVEQCEHFAAIGSGYYIAEGSLFQRSQSVENDLGTTIYNVYEAMKLGSAAPGVSDKFQIGVAEWDWYEQPNPHNHGEVKISFLEPPYYAYLAKRFARFGPKSISTVRLKPRFIKERERSLVETPKGQHERNKREREKEKRAQGRAKQSVSQKLEDQQ
jgi:hypothetical protein